MENYLVKFYVISMVYFRFCFLKWPLHFKIRDSLRYSLLCSPSLPSSFFSLQQCTALCLTNEDTILWLKTFFYTMLLSLREGAKFIWGVLVGVMIIHYARHRSDSSLSWLSFLFQLDSLVGWEAVGSSHSPDLIYRSAEVRVVHTGMFV